MGFKTLMITLWHLINCRSTIQESQKQVRLIIRALSAAGSVVYAQWSNTYYCPFFSGWRTMVCWHFICYSKIFELLLRNRGPQFVQKWHKNMLKKKFTLLRPLQYENPRPSLNRVWQVNSKLGKIGLTLNVGSIFVQSQSQR